MASTFDCLTVNDLAPITFIAGTEQTLNYYVYDQTTGCALDLSTSQCSVVISPYGNPNYIAIEVSGSTLGTPVNKFYAVISGCASSALSGKFIQQPKIIDLDGSIFRPSQGIVNITPANINA